MSRHFGRRTLRSSRVNSRVSSRVRDSVSFIFIAFFSFRCMLKDQKLQPGQRCPVGLGYSAVRIVLIESRVTGSNPVRAIIF